jgi:hypothetical protein
MKCYTNIPTTPANNLSNLTVLAKSRQSPSVCGALGGRRQQESCALLAVLRTWYKRKENKLTKYLFMAL